MKFHYNHNLRQRIIKRNFIMHHKTQHQAKSIFNNFFDELFNTSIGDIVGADMTQTYPATNIIENETHFQLQLAVPGLQKKNFHIDLDKKVLIISAEKEATTDENTPKYKRREFNYTNFKRKYTLPELVNTEAISAKYELGILTVSIPKIEKETPIKRTIEIK